MFQDGDRLFNQIKIGSRMVLTAWAGYIFAVESDFEVNVRHRLKNSYFQTVEYIFEVSMDCTVVRGVLGYSGCRDHVECLARFYDTLRPTDQPHDCHQENSRAVDDS